MMWDLPFSVRICDTDYSIRSDYRAILDICAALSDPETSGSEKTIILLDVFYPDFDTMPISFYQEAIQKCFWFINCGAEEKGNKSATKLIDWKQDWRYIAAPVNRVIGREVRSVEYMHWWTFIAAYCEIGECTLSQIVRIRDLLSRGKALDKSDREWYRKNREMVDLKTEYSAAEDEMLSKWIGGNKNPAL